MTQKNALGERLLPCCTDPLTGFFRDGFCAACDDDPGEHTICAVMSDKFLRYSLSVGNDLTTPKPQYHFQGLKAGQCWCLCTLRWVEAEQAGHAPKIKLTATHESVLKYVSLDVLKTYAVDLM